MVITLEPCNRHGRTGPCSQALIAAGISRVVVRHGDPHLIASGSAETLRRVGIDVGIGRTPGKGEQQCSQE